MFIKVKSKCIAIEEKENRSLWFTLRSSPLGRVSALARQFKSLFSFWTFLWQDSEPLWASFAKAVAYQWLGCFSHLRSQRDTEKTFVFKSLANLKEPGYRVNCRPGQTQFPPAKDKKAYLPMPEKKSCNLQWFLKKS